jgi:adenylyltransferase/sulfurtransferase
MSAMRLNDAQVDRYSRQIVLAEVGPIGQARLLESHVTVGGGGRAAEHALAYLAAAGVGRLSAPRCLHHVVDPDQTDVIIDELGRSPAAADAVVIGGRTSEEAGGTLAALIGGTHAPPSSTAGRAPSAPCPHVFWIAGGRAAALPPCPACVDAILPAVASVPAELEPARDALLGTMIATETVKALLGIGEPLRGRVLTFEPGDASVTVGTAAPARAGCALCAALADTIEG